MTQPRVLVLARNYPNSVMPMLGIWTQRLVTAARPAIRPTVMAPVPYVPPFFPAPGLARYRTIAARISENGMEVVHPRIPVPPGYTLHGLEYRLAWPFVRRVADRLHAAQGFDLIHAHFIYPDGVLAARLGQRYGVPVITSEHAVWLPWLREYPSVGRQVLAALPHIRLITTVSEAVRRTVHAVAGTGVVTEVVPNVLDDVTFRARSPGEARNLDQILFVGAVRRVKGLDVLVRALARLARGHPRLHLVVVGDPFYRAYRRHEAEVRSLVAQLGVTERVQFAGWAPPERVAAAMRCAAVVVVPSRRESFSLVAAEALASGTPVVATRCGGPEEIVTEESGHLVPVDDVAALAEAVGDVMARRSSFDPAALRAPVVERFGWATMRERLATLYRQIV